MKIPSEHIEHNRPFYGWQDMHTSSGQSNYRLHNYNAHACMHMQIFIL